MGKEQIRVLWSSGTWKRMCIWADRDHDSHWRGCNAKGGWLTVLGPLKASNIHSFLRFPWPSPSPMPSGIWKHVTRRKRDPSMTPLACKAVATCEKPMAASLYLSSSKRPRQILLLLTGLYLLSSGLALPKTDPSHRGPGRIFMFCVHLKQTL